PDVQNLLCVLLTKTTGHPLGPLWQAFLPIPTNKKPKASCIFCNPDKPISGTTAVMSSHVKNCLKISLEVHKYLLNAHNIQQQKTLMNSIIQNDLDPTTTSNRPIIPSMLASNLITSTMNHNYFIQLPLDSYESNKLLLEAQKQLSNNILNNVYKKVQTLIQQFVCKSVIGKNQRIELVKIKNIFRESQTSIVILKDLKDVITQI
ncbi:8362_t:CDS:2, partial [Racocetra persica]